MRRRGPLAGTRAAGAGGACAVPVGAEPAGLVLRCRRPSSAVARAPADPPAAAADAAGHVTLAISGAPVLRCPREAVALHVGTAVLACMGDEPLPAAGGAVHAFAPAEVVACFNAAGATVAPEAYAEAVTEAAEGRVSCRVSSTHLHAMSRQASASATGTAPARAVHLEASPKSSPLAADAYAQLQHSLASAAAEDSGKEIKGRDGVRSGHLSKIKAMLPVAGSAGAPTPPPAGLARRGSGEGSGGVVGSPSGSTPSSAASSKRNSMVDVGEGAAGAGSPAAGAGAGSGGSSSSFVKYRDRSQTLAKLSGSMQSRFQDMQTKLNRLTTGDSLATKLEIAEEAAGESSGGKIVLYTSSVQAVKKSYMECHEVRRILQMLRVPFEERDIMMSAEYKVQLRERAPGATPPVLFFNGKRLGGRDVIASMNENGKLAALFKSMPTIPVSAAGAECGVCGGKRFYPCTWCGGNKKSMCSNMGEQVVKLRCTCCNENGLIRCTACLSEENEHLQG
eukprot:m.85768 g.85768  ORF g.85768 m.85768 type:complete len:508 (+) comp15071_c0_seq1:1295-2818(+)